MRLAVREMACAYGELHHASLGLPCPALAHVPDAACVWSTGQGPGNWLKGVRPVNQRCSRDGPLEDHEGTCSQSGRNLQPVWQEAVQRSCHQVVDRVDVVHVLQTGLSKRAGTPEGSG